MSIPHEVREVLQALNTAVATFQEVVFTLQKIQQDWIQAISQSTVMQATYYGDLPLVLKVKDIAKIMGISQVKVYDIIRKPGFPAIRDGRLIVIPRDAFLQWLQSGGK